MCSLPLPLSSKDATIASRLVKVGNGLKHLVHSLPLAWVVRRSVTNHNLRRVLVWHHNCWLGQLRALCSGVVTHEGLLGHASVVDAFLGVSRPKEGRVRISCKSELNLNLIKGIQIARYTLT